MLKKKLYALMIAAVLAVPALSTPVYADEASAAITAETEAITVTNAAAGPETDAAAITETEAASAETAAETAVEPDTEVETMTESEAAAAETAAEAEAAPESDAATETEAETTAATETDEAAETEAETEADIDSGDEEPAVLIADDNAVKPISECVISTFAAKTFNGKAQTQDFTVTDETKALTPDVDYTVSYSNNINAGTATVTITGQGNYSGTVSRTFKISPKRVTPTVTLAKTSYVYSGNNLRPPATVKAGSTVLKRGTDYTVTYPASCSDVGSYNVIVTLKGNYSGSKTVPYTVVPKSTRIFSIVGTKDQFVVKWYRQTTQVTGYVVQYSLTGNYSADGQHVWITSNSNYFRTIKKPVAGRNYFVRIRTYQTVNGKKYYSPWSSAVSTVTKKTLAPQKTVTLKSPFLSDSGSQYSFKFTINNSMYVILPLNYEIADGEITKGGIRAILRDSKGNVLKNDGISLKDYVAGDSQETWVYSGETILRPGEYTYTIRNTADQDISVTFGPTTGFTKVASSVSVKKSVTSPSGNWVKIGQLSDGLPRVKDVTFPSDHIIDNYYISPEGGLYVWGEKMGAATVTVTTLDGKTYTSKVTLTAGDPCFLAYIEEYDTFDNVFIVKVMNLRRNDLTILREGVGADLNNEANNRAIKKGRGVTVKYGETKTIRFYLSGPIMDEKWHELLLIAGCTFEGKTYDINVTIDDSYIKKGDEWYYSYY